MPQNRYDLPSYLETLLEEHEDEFIELLDAAIDSLTSHLYIAKYQTKYLVYEGKRNFPIFVHWFLVYFSQNCTLQDETQSFHWTKLYCTLHPIVVYYKVNGKIAGNHPVLSPTI